MFPSNFWMFFVAALIPMVVGFIYYHPKVFGKSWMKANQFTEAYLQKGNMVVILSVSYFFSLLIAMTAAGLTVHQTVLASLMMPEMAVDGSEMQTQFNELMGQLGDRYRTFSHGIVHGIFFTLFFVLPLIGVNALFERRGWKYIFIHTGYWMITLALMMGLLCATLVW